MMGNTFLASSKTVKHYIIQLVDFGWGISCKIRLVDLQLGMPVSYSWTWISTWSNSLFPHRNKRMVTLSMEKCSQLKEIDRSFLSYSTKQYGAG